MAVDETHILTHGIAVVPGRAERIFADEKARTAWEIGRALEPITAAMPAEGQSLNARLITFRPEHKRAGRYALLLSGTVIPTDQPDVLLLPERTLLRLDALAIPYQFMPDARTNERPARL